jgi:hypothetical protein
LQKAIETERFQPFAHFAGCLDHGRESHIGPWVEIEYKPTRHLRPPWLTVPRVQLQGGNLRDGRQTLDTINLQIGFAVAKHGHEFKQTRCARHGMTLEKSFAR